MTDDDKKTEITMSDRRPIRIVQSDWPIIATANRSDDLNKPRACAPLAAGRETRIMVREHKDGRRVVSGVQQWSNGEPPNSWRDLKGGMLIGAQSDGKPDEDKTIHAIRYVAGVVQDYRLADECIADMPAEDLS